MKNKFDTIKESLKRLNKSYFHLWAGEYQGFFVELPENEKVELFSETEEWVFERDTFSKIDRDGNYSESYSKTRSQKIKKEVSKFFKQEEITYKEISIEVSDVIYLMFDKEKQVNILKEEIERLERVNQSLQNTPRHIHHPAPTPAALPTYDQFKLAEKNQGYYSFNSLLKIIVENNYQSQEEVDNYMNEE